MKSSSFFLLSVFWLLCPPAEAEPKNPNTDWFQQAGYGVFVHFLAKVQNNPEGIQSLGRETSWDDCVRGFDVERFADQMVEAGAGYLHPMSTRTIITIDEKKCTGCALCIPNCPEGALRKVFIVVFEDYRALRMMGKRALRLIKGKPLVAEKEHGMY